MAVMRFTTTRLSGLRAAGRLQELQHSVIAPFLERELGPSFGRLFADFESEGSDTRAWYIDAIMVPRSIVEMAPQEQELLRQRVAEMIGQILEFAGRIAQETSQKANLARILTDATTFPVEDIWADGSQPIIVNWGFHRKTVPVGAPRAILELVRTREPSKPMRVGPASVSTKEASRPRQELGWLLSPLLWLLFVALVAASYWRLLPACGLNEHVPSLARLPAFDACSSRMARLSDAGARLQSLVDQEELRVAERNRQCAIEGPTRAADIVGPRTATRDDEQRHIHRLTPDVPQGRVEVSLEWDDKTDLDLIIECPGGDKLWHGSTNLEACGGHLQKDVNRQGDTLTDSAIEQAAWPRSPQGQFTIKVQIYGYNSVPSDTDVPFTIRIRRDNDVQVIKGGHIKGVGSIVTASTTTL